MGASERLGKIIKVFFYLWSGLLGSALVMLATAFGLHQLWLIPIMVGLLTAVAALQGVFVLGMILMAFVMTIRAATRGRRETGAFNAPEAPDALFPGPIAGEYADTSPDESRIRAALRDLTEHCGDGCPQWVSSGVEQVLTLPPGPARQERRAELLRRLYSEAAFSSDDFETKRAYNVLRVAVNPNELDSNEPEAKV